MRSRYVAFVLRRQDYLLRTWHADHRPLRLDFDVDRWLGLEILRCEGGMEHDVSGLVEFRAAFEADGECRVLHEVSRFKCVDGCWFYVDGVCRMEHPGRNARCPCGSGRRFKRCCSSMRRTAPRNS